MTDEPTSDSDKKKPHPAILIGPAVAIGAALLAVFISTRGGSDDAAPNPVASGEIASIQSAGSGEPQTPDTPAPPPPGAAAITTDSAINFADDAIAFSATLPEGPADDPVLNYLRKDTQAYLDKYKANARADKEERKRLGGIEMAWEVNVEWKYTARAGGIVSLVGSAYEFTGGAHGMTNTSTHIARADTGEELTVDAMMQHGRSPSPALVIAICEALKAAKLKSIGSATIYDEPIVCAGPTANVKTEEAKFALAPSSEADKFGGLLVYYDAYAVGPYVEGSYDLVIPQEVFREDLRKEFQPLFAGKPVNPT